MRRNRNLLPARFTITIEKREELNGGAPYLFYYAIINGRWEKPLWQIEANRVTPDFEYRGILDGLRGLLEPPPPHAKVETHYCGD